MDSSFHAFTVFYVALRGCGQVAAGHLKWPLFFCFEVSDSGNRLIWGRLIQSCRESILRRQIGA